MANRSIHEFVATSDMPPPRGIALSSIPLSVNELSNPVIRFLPGKGFKYQYYELSFLVIDFRYTRLFWINIVAQNLAAIGKPLLGPPLHFFSGAL